MFTEVRKPMASLGVTDHMDPMASDAKNSFLISLCLLLLMHRKLGQNWNECQARLPSKAQQV